LEILCQLQNINLSFGEKTLFKQAGFSLHFGEKIGLIGLNGQGKSTLFKVLTGELIPESSDPPFIFSKGKGQNDADKIRKQSSEKTSKYTVLLLTHPGSEIPLSLARINKYSSGVNRALKKFGGDASVAKAAKYRVGEALKGNTFVKSGIIRGGSAFGIDVNVMYWIIKSKK